MRKFVAIVVLIGQFWFATAAVGQSMPQQGMTIGDLPAPISGAMQPYAEGRFPSDSIDSRFTRMEAQLAQLQRQVDATSMRFDGNCQSACNAADCCCNQCRQRNGWYAGGAVVFAKPHFKEAFQISETNLTNGLQSLVPFSYDYSATPRVWFGFRQCNSGLRLSYWEFDQDGDTTINQTNGTRVFGSHVVSVIFPANIFANQPGQTLIANDSLETQIINLHATFDGDFDGIDYTGGIGIRYSKLVQSYEATVLNAPSQTVVVPSVAANLQWQRVFNGIGPSVDFDMRKRLGCSAFSAVANGGGALLFGEKSLNRTVFGDQSPQPAAPFLNLEKADEVVGVGELGFGLEWAGCTSGGREIRIRGSYEGQLWAEAGAPTLGFLGFQAFALRAEILR